MAEPKFNKRYDNRRYDPNNLNLRDLEIMNSLEVEKNSHKKTAEKVHVSTSTVTRTTKKRAYRDIVIASMEEQGATPETYAANIIKLMKAKKLIVSKKEGIVTTDDNIVQFNATSEFGDILGVKAPKEFDLKHTMAAMSDEELQEAVNNSAKELNGHIQHSITGASHESSVIANTVANAEPRVVEQAREQAVRPTDGREV